MTRREIRSWLMDMDGVLVREQDAVPGAPEFLARLRELGMPFLVLTNNSIYTPRDLAARLMPHRARRAGGVDLDIGARDRAVPGRPAPRRLGVRDRRVGPDDGAA